MIIYHTLCVYKNYQKMSLQALLFIFFVSGITFLGTLSPKSSSEAESSIVLNELSYALGRNMHQTWNTSVHKTFWISTCRFLLQILLALVTLYGLHQFINIKPVLFFNFKALLSNSFNYWSNFKYQSLVGAELSIK